ncbi:MAG: FIST C-terminal domain-containing protein [Gemmatimonadetes bacterium]|nr:FIST C-terminal domain-containing protein [Gemmatimonadota bacterium]
MRIEQQLWTLASGWVDRQVSSSPFHAQLVLVFGAPAALRSATVFPALHARYPEAAIVGCSTAGEICGVEVHDDSVVATALEFDATATRVVCLPLPSAAESAAVGRELASSLLAKDLKHVIVFSTGLDVNGSDLVTGLSDALPSHVAATGGLAGDGARFGETTIYCDRAHHVGAVAAIGFYGERVEVGFGSMGGWDSFGPDRLVTRSRGNVLFELDGESALSLYRRYLGPHAARLPSSGLLFPLSLRGANGQPRVVRTIVGIDEEAGSLTFAGDVPEGSYVRLMKANTDQLIDGAQGAALACHEGPGSSSPAFALLISCVGRKLLLKQHTESEVESVRSVFGEGTVLGGFYSYGEIAPFSAPLTSELRNSTMTITTVNER